MTEATTADPRPRHRDELRRDGGRRRRRCAGGRAEILSNVVLSQLDEHAAFGGVVPEIAARAHVEALDGIIAAALGEAGAARLPTSTPIAATAGPGLIGGLIVGLMTAKAIAAAPASR